MKAVIKQNAEKFNCTDGILTIHHMFFEHWIYSLVIAILLGMVYFKFTGRVAHCGWVTRSMLPTSLQINEW